SLRAASMWRSRAWRCCSSAEAERSRASASWRRASAACDSASARVLSACARPTSASRRISRASARRVSYLRLRPARPRNHRRASTISAPTTMATITPVSIPVLLPFGLGSAYPALGEIRLLRRPLTLLLLDELALQHLAGGVARQLVDEDDLARHLVAREV